MVRVATDAAGEDTIGPPVESTGGVVVDRINAGDVRERPPVSENGTVIAERTNSARVEVGDAGTEAAEYTAAGNGDVLFKVIVYDRGLRTGHDRIRHGMGKRHGSEGACQGQVQNAQSPVCRRQCMLVSGCSIFLIVESYLGAHEFIRTQIELFSRILTKKIFPVQEKEGRSQLPRNSNQTRFLTAIFLLVTRY